MRLIDQLFSESYDDLCRMAAHVLSTEGRGTMSATGLVSEAYLKLQASRRLEPDSPLHFKRIAVRAMRQVLIEAARRRNALKRCSHNRVMSLADESVPGEIRPEPFDYENRLALRAALAGLARISPRQAKLVEYRFFHGYGLAETAERLGISESTALREWRIAKGHLSSAFRDDERASVQEDRSTRWTDAPHMLRSDGFGSASE